MKCDINDALLGKVIKKVMVWTLTFTIIIKPIAFIDPASRKFAPQN
ncbi:MAG: hypothetical protein ACJARF_001621 [Alteromonadaceae bacterium]|jgi:hypothetical protein|tara:strand:- start:4647 stop:4784 length:138 start_codon:yes stop_codon:yes gene_type:complete